MIYRPEIDGLRAVAVLPVILFHVGFEIFSGGFIGVDVFFVISGYLITTILIENLDNNSFSIYEFYKKRARRILPAVYFLLLMCVLYALYIDPFSSRDLFQSIFATTIFSQNILLFFESSNYFDLSTEYKPLVHMWTLGIEEQFYIVFPIILFMIHKFDSFKKIKFFLFLFFISFIASIHYTNINIDFSFYMIITRGWELLVGTLTAIYLYYFNHNFGKRINNIYSFAGLFLILLSIFILSGNDKFPYYSTLLPTLGTSLLIIFTKNNTVLFKFLSNKILIWIGLISYSLYLWHQPIIVFFKDQYLDFGTELLSHHKIFIIILIFIFSVFSYYLVERPLRNKNLVKDKYFYSLILIITIFLLVISFFGNKSVGYESLKINKNNFRQHLYINQLDEVEKAKKIWLETENNFDITLESKILIIGNSMGADTQSSLFINGVNSTLISIDGLCFESLVKNGYSCGVRLDSIQNEAIDKNIILIATDFAKENSEDEVVMLSKELNKIAPTYVIGSYRFKNASKLSYNIASSDMEINEIKKLFWKNIDPRIFQTNKKLRNSFNEFFIDKKSAFCDDNLCILYDEKYNPLFYDELHMTYEGKKIFGNFLINKINKQLTK